jgi:SPP1 gp7 family putative phage head morphogenesis protein
MATNDELASARIKHALEVTRFANSVAGKALAEMNATIERMIVRIELEKDTDPTRMTALLDDVKRVYLEGVAKLRGTLEADLKAQAAYEAEYASAQLSGITVGANPIMASEALVWSAVMETPMDRGYIYDEILKGFEEGTAGKITAAIRQSVIEGDSIQALVEKLRGSYGVGGILETEIGPHGKIYTLVPNASGEMVGVYKAAESIARTAVMHIMNTAASVTYEANADMLSGVGWSATLDEVTCIECGDLDGEVWDMFDDHPVPPAHRNCRCALVPIAKGWEDMADALGMTMEDFTEAEKKALDGAPPRRQSYEEWLGGQPKDVQDEALGSGRAELFRAGTKLDDMTDKGRTLTLEELKKKG